MTALLDTHVLLGVAGVPRWLAQDVQAPRERGRLRVAAMNLLLDTHVLPGVAGVPRWLAQDVQAPRERGGSGWQQ